MTQQKFSLGQLLATPGAFRRCRRAAKPQRSSSAATPTPIGAKSATRIRRLNDQSLIDGSRLLSAYRTANGTKLWVITEAADDDGHRMATTILLPENN